MTEPATGVGARLPLGTQLGGRYSITGVLRDDGGSILYLGRLARARSEPVVIKEIVTDSFASLENRVNAERRLVREVEVLQTVRHPALPVVLDAFTAHDSHYVVMSYQPGEALDVMLARRRQPFAEEDVVGWALEILSALGALHQHDPPVIYRNLKPANMVLDPSGTLRLLDFGLVRYVTPGKRCDTAPIGAPGYAPPEQTSSATDPRSDLYALGATMYHLLTNQHPARHLPGLLPPATCNPAVSAEGAAIIARAMDPEPARRWATAGEMELVLRRHAFIGGTAPRLRADMAPPQAGSAPPTPPPTARLLITTARPSSGRGEALDYLARLTWMTRDELENVLTELPAVVPLVEPYKASLRMLKGLGIEARPLAPLRGRHVLDVDAAHRLAADGRVEIQDPAACDDGLCLCRHCRFGWMHDDPAAPLPERCPSCGGGGWSASILLRCRWCGHEYEERESRGACPCCGLA